MKLISYLLIGVLFFFHYSPTFAADAIGQVVWVRGDVQAIDINNQSRKLERRSPIYEKDTITTTATSTGQIEFTDSSTVALRSGTVFRVDEYKFDRAASKKNKYVVDIAKGGFRTITGLISKTNPANYKVNTPVATIGVRGTDYTIFYKVGKGLSVKLTKGIIVVSNSAGTVELNAARNRVYAEIAGLRVAPVVVDKPGGKPLPESGTAPQGRSAPATKSSGTVSNFCIQ